MNTLEKMAAALLLSLLSSMATAAITESLLTTSLSGPREAAGLTEFDLWIKTEDIPFFPGDPILPGDPIWSGGLILTYNPNVLDFHSFIFAVSGTTGTPQEGCGTVLTGCISGVTFNSYPTPGNPYATQNAGGVKIGTYKFLYKVGESELILGKDPSAPFLNGSAGTPDFDSQITKVEWGTAMVVPLPLAAWLMLSGLGMLGAFGFRKTS